MELQHIILLPVHSQFLSTVTEGGYTPEHVSKIVKTLKNGKSSFIDGSINEVIKHSISSTSTLLAKLFNRILPGGGGGNVR